MSDKFLAAIAMISNDLSRWARARRAAADLETARNHEEHHTAYLAFPISHFPSLDSLFLGHLRNRAMLESLTRPAYQRFSQYAPNHL